MDNCLTFNIHIDEIHKKVTGTLLYINRISDKLEFECRVMVVQSLVLSILNYCLRVWGSTNKVQMDRAQKIQNFAAKVASGGARKYDHVTPILEKLKWLRLDKKYIYEICILVFRICNNSFPEWLFKLPTVGQVRGERVNTRGINTLFTPRTKSDTGDRAINVVGPTIWNQLPTNIKNCQTLSSIKYHLLKFLHQ